jgi:hypothetical protein
MTFPLTVLSTNDELTSSFGLALVVSSTSLNGSTDMLSVKMEKREDIVWSLELFLGLMHRSTVQGREADNGESPPASFYLGE